MAGEGLPPAAACLIAYAIFILLKCHETAEVLTAGQPPERLAAAQTAVALMGMTNVYYSFTDTVGDTALSAEAPGMRMQGYVNHGGVDKKLFKTLTLAVSIVGKCKPFIKAHIEELKKTRVVRQRL